MKTITLLFLLLSLQLSSQNYNQKSIDSLVLATDSRVDDTVKCINYNIISIFYLYVNSTKGLLYADKEISIATVINWEKGIGTGYLDMGRQLISKGDYVRSSKDLTIAEEIFTRTADFHNLANVYNQMGILKANQNKFPEALDYFFKAIKKLEHAKEKPSLLNTAYLYQNIANIYNATENYDKALESYDDAISLFEKIGDHEPAAAMNIGSKGLVYQKQNKLGEALKAHLAAEKILSRLNEESFLVFVNSWLGSVYLSLKDYDQSLTYSNKALKTIQIMGDEVLKANTIQNIGYAHLKKGMSMNNASELATGLENISASLTLNKKLGNIEALLNDYKYLSEYYEFKKEYANSLEAYKNYTLYNDSIYNSKNKQSLQNLQDERTIEMRDNEIEVNKLNLETKEKQKWFLISAIILFMVIGALLLYQSRSRKKINETLRALNSELDEANKTKTRFFTILNHDLRGPVSNLIHFLHLKNDSPELLTEELKKEMENKTISAAENLLVSMEDLLLWSKGQMQNFKPVPQRISIDQLFEDLRNHFLSFENVRIEFQNPQNIHFISDPDYLKTIMRNLTGNSLKALEKTIDPTIVWKAWQENNHIYLSITDNGPGGTQQQFKALYDETEVVGIKTGLGLHLIRDLAKAINCIITVESKVNGGTTIILKFD
ncbi:MAG: tetratricopeptide repeat-containing sensor histidine kinase [Bacteroidota bacterium]